MRVLAMTVGALLIAADSTLRTLFVAPRASRACPNLSEHDEDHLSEVDRAQSGALMRVNHVGEVCAQALYTAQALAARSTGAARQPDHALAAQLETAGREETDHLAWACWRVVSGLASAWVSWWKPSVRLRPTWPATWSGCRRRTTPHAPSWRR